MEEEVPFAGVCLIGTVTRAVTHPEVSPHLVCGDCELFGAVHHVSGSVLGPTQPLAALVQGLAGLLHGAGHAVRSRVQYAVPCRRRGKGSCESLAQTWNPSLSGVNGGGKTGGTTDGLIREGSWTAADPNQGSGVCKQDLRSASRKAFQRCFPSNFPLSCPLIAFRSPEVSKWGRAPASAGPPHHVDRRQSSSSYSPGSPADASTNNPLICHTSGVLLLCTTSTPLPAARPLSAAQYFIF